MPNYFLYARKSTDVEDKQVRSIDDQLTVLRALAKEQNFSITREFIKRQSAKMPGHPVFDEMLALIEKGEARGGPQTQWASAMEAHCLAGKKSFSWIMVGGIGLDPYRVSTPFPFSRDKNRSKIWEKVFKSSLATKIFCPSKYIKKLVCYNSNQFFQKVIFKNGRGGIRTHVGLAPPADFESAPL
ncbi:MAG: Recombinase [Parcubacteria group bacterium GW2011_GWA2_47_21]|nr:MAG: Recombinase [Parcubacteria group bacterium GW2011_GWA2_47_21]